MGARMGFSKASASRTMSHHGSRWWCEVLVGWIFDKRIAADRSMGIERSAAVGFSLDRSQGGIPWNDHGMHALASAFSDARCSQALDGGGRSENGSYRLVNPPELWRARSPV